MQQRFLLQTLLLAEHVSGITMPIIRSQEYYTVVAACGISCCGFSSSWYGVELRVMRPVQTGRITLSSTPDQLLEKPQHEIPQAATTV